MKNKKAIIAALLGSGVLLSNNKDTKNNRNIKNNKEINNDEKQPVIKLNELISISPVDKKPVIKSIEPISISPVNKYDVYKIKFDSEEELNDFLKDLPILSSDDFIGSVLKQNPSIDNKLKSSLESASLSNDNQDIVLPELNFISTPKKGKEFENLSVIDKEKDIYLETYVSGDKEVKKEKIGTKYKKEFYYKGYKIAGGKEVRNYLTYTAVGKGKEEKEEITRNESFFSVEESKEKVIVYSKNKIKEIYQKQYKCKIDDNDLQLVYYKPKDLNKLIPMYQVGRKESGPKRINKMKIENNKESKDININLMGMYFPSNSKYAEDGLSSKPNLNIEYVKDVPDNKDKDDDQRDDDVSNDQGSNDQGNNQIKDMHEYKISFLYSPGLKEENINLLGNFKVIDKKTEKVDDELNLYSFKCIGNLEKLRDPKSNTNTIIINYINKYDFSKSFAHKYNPKDLRKPKLPVGISIDRISSVIPNRISSVKTPSRIPSIASSRGHTKNEWGIEWGEDLIGGSCYSNFVNSMNSQSSTVNKYQWITPNAWKNDFWDKDKTGGLDHRYIDDVDTSVIIAHGNGHGFDLEGPGPNNGDLTYWDANDGKTWGNKDLEFHAWLSCQVLEEEWTFTDDAGNTQRRQWYERWGPTFNGLHLICGFQTNAFVATHKHLQYFAENMYEGDGKTVRRSWFDAADADQPDDVEAVVMGPLISDNTDSKGDFKSINATTPNAKRAYWNDKVWGKGGSGKDVTKSSSGKSSEVIGWWRIVHTV